MKVKLRDVSNIIMGQSPDSSTYNTEKIGLPFFQGNADFGELNPIAKTWCSAPIKIAYKNYILISVRAPIGALNIAAETCCIGRGLAAFDVNNKMCTQKYLWYLLKAKKNELLSKGTGSTFKAISKNILSEMEFNIPPVREQELCTKVLDVVFCLIRLKKEQLDKLDLLVKSRFVEMFGDLVCNPFNWEKEKLGNVLLVQPQNGIYKPQSEYVNEGGHPILRIDGFYHGKVLSFSALKRLRCSKQELDKYGLRSNDIVINRVNSIEYLGKSAVIDGLIEPTVFESNMMRMHPDEHIINSKFMVIQLLSKFMYNQILRHAKKAVNQASINQKDVQDFDILLPPIELQNSFVNLLTQVDKSKLAIQKSLDELETLKKSLMQQYFG